ncbi:type IV pilus secretin PilQ [uncultured Propionivibrio sp.]|uniref:type IV pilus secretin PilQ n=1 Tax=uncultured Propionivibrio sp. TaxID=426737 RepID=UPI0029BFBD1C|nr:type IV pilus secretin PilQ [uncultured Propionivibrio sp.]
MKKAMRFLLGVVWLVSTSVLAQESPRNAIESITAARQGGSLNVKLTFSKPLMALPAGFSVAKPARIALDFPGVENGLGRSVQTFNEGDLKSVNIVQVEGKTRLVFNLNQAMVYESRADGRGLLLVLTPSAEKEWQRSGGSVPVEHFSQAATPANNTLRDVTFRRGKDGEARILVDLSNAATAIDLRQQGQSLVVDFVKTSVPEVLRKRLDVTDFATPVVSVDTVQQGPNARMTITPRGAWEHNAYQSDSQFVIEVRPVVEDPNKLVQGSRPGYQGEKLSLNFQNVDVRRLLQVIGEFTGMNMVVSDSVGGAITLILKDVPWDQALDIILKQKGLDMRKNGNVILIAPRDEIATKEKLDFEARAQIDDLEPLRTESFQMNYVKGEDVRKLLADPKQTLLSKRGSAVLDNRSNIMFVKDTPNRIEDIRNMIAKIDIPVRQVVIEARIIEAEDSFAKNLGSRLGWGGTTASSGGTLAFANGTPTGQIGGAQTLIGGMYSTNASVNLPATPAAGAAGTFGFMLFNSAQTRYLTAEISALESDGRGKIVSSPRVMTANQIEALIEQGVEIPYQQATSSGATSVSFRKANLSLKVKPQITPDGKITMTLDINKDSPNTSISTGSGVAIDTKHVKTEVLVDNGGTVVIGGIYTENIQNTSQRIPFFGDLPYLGWLFKNTAWTSTKKELLVFITPKIVAEGLAVR